MERAHGVPHTRNKEPTTWGILQHWGVKARSSKSRSHTSIKDQNPADFPKMTLEAKRRGKTCLQNSGAGVISNLEMDSHETPNRIIE